MLYSSKNREDLEKIKNLATLQNQVKSVRLQDKLGKQNFHEDMKKLYEPLTDTIKDVSDDISKVISETSIRNTKTISDLNEKVLELMDEKGLIAPYLASSLVNLSTPENRSQFRLKKDLNSPNMNEFSINGDIPVNLYSNMITFRDSNESFKLDGDILKTITNYDFIVDHSKQPDRKLIYEFLKEMKYNIKQKGKKSKRDISLKRLLESPAIMASGVSETIFLSSDPDELCD